MSIVETFFFNKGLNTRRSPLLIEDGELTASSGLVFDTEGKIVCRSPMETVNTTVYGDIKGLHRYINLVLMQENGNLRYKWDLDGYCDLYVPANGNFTLLSALRSSDRPSFADYDDFTFIVTGMDRKVFTQGNLYEWGVENPTEPPAGTSGAAGNPNGTYIIYYTYLVHYPNGFIYETGPSPSASVTVSNAKISITGIKPCPYTGNGIVIHRKLYRYSTTIGSIFYVATITDNTTTTYTDDTTDAVLETNSILDTTTYNVPPYFTDICVYLSRIFGVVGEDLYFSEPYEPMAFPITNFINVSTPGDQLTGVTSWGDQLFIPSKKTWRRLQGSDSDTWAIRSTFADKGCINPHTIVPTIYGILGLWYDGIYTFDGSLSRPLTRDKISRSTFLNISDTDACYARWDGEKYKFYYPESGSTISKCLVIDFSNYGKGGIRCYYDDFLATANEYHFNTGISYTAKGGYQYKTGSTETISASLTTGDRAAKDVLKQKQTEYLYYDIYTAGKDVTVTLYADGATLSPTYTINESARKRTRIPLGNHQGYRFSISLSCADSKDIEIYEPWAISFNPFGN